MLWRILVAALLLLPAGAYVAGDLTSHDEPRPPRPAIVLPADGRPTGSPDAAPRSGKPDRPDKPGDGKKGATPTVTPPSVTDDDCDDDDEDETTLRPCPDDVDDDGPDDDGGSDDEDDD